MRYSLKSKVSCRNNKRNSSVVSICKFSYLFRIVKIQPKAIPSKLNAAAKNSRTNCSKINCKFFEIGKRGQTKSSSSSSTMDATIDIKSLEEAVTVFYRSGAQQQSNAHDWLTKAQLSPQAWSFVWDLMQLGKVTKLKLLLGNFHFR